LRGYGIAIKIVQIISKEFRDGEQKMILELSSLPLQTLRRRDEKL
jgi:hypothetical protein